MMTMQEAFNKSVLGVVAQGRPSIENGFCLYRAPNGCKCALGHLIADEHYHPGLENTTANSTALRKALAASGMDVGGIDAEADMLNRSDLLMALQVAHDHAALKTLRHPHNFVANFIAECRDVARNHCLQVPEGLGELA